MPEVLNKPPVSPTDEVVDIIHGMPVADPYRWLEDQQSPRTREWLRSQTIFAREYLDSIPGRELIRSRIRDFLEIETFDSLLVHEGKYIFRKRLPYQEQPCIYMRNGADGKDQLLLDPSAISESKYTAVKPMALSPNGKILAYEVKEGGERASRVEFLDVATRTVLPDRLSHGYLRAFAFAPNSESVYYAIDPLDSPSPVLRQHKFRTLNEQQDLIVFQNSNSGNARLAVISGPEYLLIFVHHLNDRRLTDCYVQPYEASTPCRQLLAGIDYTFAPRFVGDRIFLLTSLEAPNCRICEMCLNSNGTYDLTDVVPTSDSMIMQWIALNNHIVVCYGESSWLRLVIFTPEGKRIGEIPVAEYETAHLLAGDSQAGEVLFQSESFFDSPLIWRYSLKTGKRSVLMGYSVGLDRDAYASKRKIYRSSDGTEIPMFLVGRRDRLEYERNPVILTSYGGFRHVMTPQFSVFVSFLMEKGCVFALPGIRGGGEFGEGWHSAGKRHNRQNAFDDFRSAAEWLIDAGIADPKRIAIFGGSNSGLLVGVAITQAPHLYRAALLNAPLLDMVRYHLFNGAIKWKSEFGTAEDARDFAVLFSYSPYHRIEPDTSYPAVMMISGDLDQNCNPLHARKTIARLQAANISSYPIILDYSSQRGHSPVLPLSTRIDALTDRMAFFCNELGLTI